MGTPSKIFNLSLFSLLAWLQLGAQNSCTPCNQLIFKENKGQWNSNVRYRTEMHYANVYFEQGRFTYQLLDTADLKRYRSHHPWGSDYKVKVDHAIHGHAFYSNFIGCNKTARIIPSDPESSYFNYYIGKDPSKWASGVHAFHQLVYNDIYDGIDLNVSSEQLNVIYDWIVKGSFSKPAPAQLPIKINYQGAGKVSLSDNRLIIETTVGNLIESKPYAYQLINGQKLEVRCNYTLDDNGIVAFNFPNGWDHQNDLIIDPTLIFSTYSGSYADNFGYTATFDSKSNAYAAGSVFSLGYPVTPGAFQYWWGGGWGFYHDSLITDGSGTDVSITKYSADGTTRLYSTYLGGRGDELPHSLIVNNNDELFVFGTTGSDNFPVTSGAFDTTFNGGIGTGALNGIGVDYNNGSDIFIAHFNGTGTALIGSTYVGGSDNDGLNEPEYQDLNYQYADDFRGSISVDNNNNVYVASCTRSANFPVTAGAYQTRLNGPMNAVVFKMDNYLTQMVWSTYLGGNKLSDAYSITLDNTGNVFVCGGTQSDSFPTTAGCFQPFTHGGRAEGFITELNQNGSAILASTLFGTPVYDQLFFVQVDRRNNVYVLGQTMDTSNFFMKNATYQVPKSGQYISKFDHGLDSLIWSSRFGTGSGIPDLSPTAFLVDVCNSVYMAGWGSDFAGLYGFGPYLSTSGMFVTPDAYQPTTDGNDFYVMVMKDDASAITYATYFGSPRDEEHVDGGTSRFDKKGVIYQSVCAGCANNLTGGLPDQNFPTYPANVVSHRNNSPNCNNAIFKLDLNLPLVIADFNTPPTICDTFNYQFINNSKIFDTATTVVSWNFGDGSTSNQLNPFHAYTVPGVYTITLIISDSTSCNGNDTVRKQMTILRNDSTVRLPTLVACPGYNVQIGIPPITDSATTFQWTPTTGLNNPNITDPFTSPEWSTNYQLEVNKGNCHAFYYQQVTVNHDSLKLHGASVLCPYDTIQLFVTDTAGKNLSYQWSPANLILSGANTSDPFVKPPRDTVYYVTATDSAGCRYTDSAHIKVVSQLQNVQVTATPDTIRYGDTSQLNVIFSQASSLYWAPDSSLSNLGSPDPLAWPKMPDTYWVTVIDSSGCVVKKPVSVYILLTPCASSNLFVPNAFSPNNDGKNDVLYVRGNYIQQMYFAVYDRWGQKVFETRNQNTGWDGTYNGKKLDPSVFGWYLEGTCDAGEKFFKKGNVTLLR